MKKVRISLFHPFSKLRNEQGAGFTLLELIVVIAIIGTLAAIAIPAYYVYIEKARIAKACAEIRIIEKEIMAYRTTAEDIQGDDGIGDLPDSLADIDWDDWLDPWDNPYQYANHDIIPPGDRRKYKSTVPLNTDFDLYSMGPDGESKPPITAGVSYDDIIRAGDGEYVGPASEY